MPDTIGDIFAPEEMVPANTASIFGDIFDPEPGVPVAVDNEDVVYVDPEEPSSWANLANFIPLRASAPAPTAKTSTDDLWTTFRRFGTPFVAGLAGSLTASVLGNRRDHPEAGGGAASILSPQSKATMRPAGIFPSSVSLGGFSIPFVPLIGTFVAILLIVFLRKRGI